MKTTVLTIEFILIGFQVLAWLTMLVLTVFGYNWIDLATLHQWRFELSVALVGAAYTCGLLCDKLIGSIDWPLRFGVSLVTEVPELPQSPAELRMRILATNKAMYEALENRMNQIRLLRSTLLNVCLFVLFGILFALIRTELSWGHIFFLVVVFVFFAMISVLTWRQSRSVWFAELVSAHRVIRTSNNYTYTQDDE